MFQDFETPDERPFIAERVRRLRAEMAKRELDAFLVPRADEHQGEYVPPSAERLRWISGFSGSAGMAAVTRRAACLLVDGRYTLQAPQQTDTGVFTIRQIPEQKVSDWLLEQLAPGGRIGFDPWLHTAAEIERLKESVGKRKLVLVPVPSSPLDKAWGSARPAPPSAPVVVQPVRLAGASPEQKLALVQERLKADGQDAVVLTLTDSICWLFNIRGADVAHNPVVLAFAIVPVKGKAELFIGAAKIGEEAAAHLAPHARIVKPAELAKRLAALKAAGRKVRYDKETAAFAIGRALGKSGVAGRDPVIAMKAVKCTAEIKGTRAAHQRDGVAMVRFLAWLDREGQEGAVDEIEAVRQLESFRRVAKELRDISFDTISGSGPNGAIVHYRVATGTNRKLAPGELFLIDSGGQYVDGTTDVTRTVAIGTPSPEMRRHYTAVLKGHIAISTARFPVGTRGVDLDPLARVTLWSMGLDYDHGTGHGVGSYLSVHEGPASISKRGMVALEPGMILSNEPGFYKRGAYGIRIENLVLVEKASVPSGGERAMLSFETLTLVPYDRRLIEVADLTSAERAWIDAYHVRVRDTLGPLVEDDAATARWLKAATAGV